MAEYTEKQYWLGVSSPKRIWEKKVLQPSAHRHNKPRTHSGLCVKLEGCLYKGREKKENGNLEPQSFITNIEF